jgi:hypothetical protein
MTFKEAIFHPPKALRGVDSFGLGGRIPANWIEPLSFRIDNY